MTPDLAYVIEQERQKHPERGKLADCVVAIDPGETTGLTYMVGSVVGESIQVKTPTVEDLEELLRWLNSLRAAYHVNVAVIESYRIFSWKAEQHVWAGLHTPQLIGALRLWFRMERIPVVMQSPQVAKGFVTDQKLKDWDLWVKGQPHARDAIRHGIYFQIFGDAPE